jgi:ABC-type branched-subunit amino acid transport system permease subunit
MKVERAPVGWGLWLQWVVATIVGGAVGGAMSEAVFRAVGLYGAVYAAITGAALVWLLRQPRPTASTGE